MNETSMQILEISKLFVFLKRCVEHFNCLAPQNDYYALRNDQRNIPETQEIEVGEADPEVSYFKGHLYENLNIRMKAGIKNMKKLEGKVHVNI